jgi:hypothetical protein
VALEIQKETIMNLAQQFIASVNKSNLEMFSHDLNNSDSEDLIKQHLAEFGHDAEIKDHHFTNDDGASCDSIDLIFNDGSECNIHEYDIETTA